MDDGSLARRVSLEGESGRNMDVSAPESPVAVPPRKKPETISTRKTRSDAARQVTPRANEHKWKVGQKVYVKLYDGKWTKGEVYDVRENIELNGQQTSYAVSVQVQDENGVWFLPATWDESPQEIPQKHIRRHLCMYDEFHESLDDNDKLTHRVLKLNSTSRSPSNDDVAEVLSQFDGMVLNEESNVSLKKQVLRLSKKPEVAKVIQTALGSDDERSMSSVNILAYLFGQIAACQLQRLSASRDEKLQKHGGWILDGLAKSSSTTSLDQFQDLDCPVIKIFLMAMTVTRTAKRTSFDPTAGLLDKRAMDVLDNQEHLESRVSKLLTALSCIHAAQSHDLLAGPAAAAIFHGIDLILNMKGVTDGLLKALSEHSITASGKLLRKYIVMAAAAIDFHDVRACPEDGRVPVVIDTADNADFHLFARVLSVIPVGNLLLGYEDAEDVDHMNLNYIQGLPPLSENMAEKILPTEADDAVAQETIALQNIYTLLSAALSSEDSF